MTDVFRKDHTFSIVIPTYNEQENISNCIDSILKQNYDLNLIDIVIVDGHSSDNTITKIKEYQKKFANISLLENPVRRTPTSLNIGIKEAKGEIIIILGAHASLDPDFIFFNNKYLKEKNVNVTGERRSTLALTSLRKQLLWRWKILSEWVVRLIAGVKRNSSLIPLFMQLTKRTL